MTYEQLIVLNAIVSEGTFRGAAERLHKSQSAISHMMKKLEEEIGFTLLSREEYRPKLTSTGEVFFRQSTRVIQQMQELTQLSKRLGAKQEAAVFLAVTATYPMGPFLKVIKKTRDEFPMTAVRMSRETMGGPLERLINGEADIIVSTLDDVPIDRVEAIPFAQVTITPVAHPDYLPTSNSSLKTIAEMQSYTQVIVSDSSSGSFEQSRDLLPGGLRWAVSDFAAKKEILLSKMGWGGMPKHEIDTELKEGKLVEISVEGYPQRNSQLYLIRLRDQEAGLVSQTLWDELCALSQR